MCDGALVGLPAPQQGIRMCAGACCWLPCQAQPPGAALQGNLLNEVRRAFMVVPWCFTLALYTLPHDEMHAL